jgi:hypothetical protein
MASRRPSGSGREGTAASRHTPVSVGDDEVITLNIVQGDWNLMSPEGQVLDIENWKSMMERYLNHCRTLTILSR